VLQGGGDLLWQMMRFFSTTCQTCLVKPSLWPPSPCIAHDGRAGSSIRISCPAGTSCTFVLVHVQKTPRSLGWGELLSHSILIPSILIPFSFHSHSILIPFSSRAFLALHDLLGWSLPRHRKDASPFPGCDAHPILAAASCVQRKGSSPLQAALIIQAWQKRGWSGVRHWAE
jgi:hypothetical protein